MPNGFFRIIALRDFADVKAGDIGGYVGGENNLSHEGNCWIYDDAMAYDAACVIDDATMHDQAEIFGNAVLLSNAMMRDRSSAFCCAWIGHNAFLHGCEAVGGHTSVIGHWIPRHDLPASPTVYLH